MAVPRPSPPARAEQILADPFAHPASTGAPLEVHWPHPAVRGNAIKWGRAGALDRRARGHAMARIDWKDRVVIESDLHHGDPCIKGTRIPVSIIGESIADGMTADEVRAAYPQLSLEDIRAALAYVADVL